ncbi:PDDEXK nuclease domain-containing protein [Myxococcota bacterium]|nr:PDDEXK nuclease domain-containing protein [Myxococcota bacterium]
MAGSFATLVRHIGAVDHAALRATGRRAQQILCLRNWLIGAWIVVYEQDGEDRAAYGTALLDRLASVLKEDGHHGLSARNLRNYRQVALAFPALEAASLAASLLPEATAIGQAPANSLPIHGPSMPIRQAPAGSPQPAIPWRDSPWHQRLFTELTFTHLLEFARMDDPLERAFYELHCVKEGWTTRELIRQRSTMLYQRVGLSTDRDAVLAVAREGRVDDRPQALVRDPYVLEFLGLPSMVDEASLEGAILDHLQAFLMELGREFCFVARQYRVTLGNRHHHLDLLFFHRRLRCLVAIDLKSGEFTPQDAGQMRFYLNYLAAEATLEGESPPIGILLCAAKDEEVVQFATAIDDDVLVSRYLLELPTRERLVQWLHEAREAAEATVGRDPGRD